MLARWRRWVGEQLAFLIVALGIAAAFLYLLVVPERWRPATVAIAVAVLLGGLLRLLLPTVRVGFLAVRGRGMDTVFYLVLGGLILAVDLRLRT